MTQAMSIAPMPRAVLFDVYGTLFDVYSVSQRLEELFSGQGARVASRCGATSRLNTRGCAR